VHLRRQDLPDQRHSLGSRANLQRWLGANSTMPTAV